MACYLYGNPYLYAVTLIVSPHRAGLTVAEATALIQGIDFSDLETKETPVYFAFSEVTDDMVAPGSWIPDHPGSDIAYAEAKNRNGKAPAGLAADVLARWEAAYAKEVHP